MGKDLHHKIVLDFGPFVQGMQKVGDTMRRFMQTVHKHHYLSTAKAPGPFVGSVDI